jgi:hypothetical protein
LSTLSNSLRYQTLTLLFLHFLLFIPAFSESQKVGFFVLVLKARGVNKDTVNVTYGAASFEITFESTAATPMKKCRCGECSWDVLL